MAKSKADISLVRGVVSSLLGYEASAAALAAPAPAKKVRNAA